MKNVAAFYDIDGTLYREALSIELFKKLSKNGIVPDYKWYTEVKPIYDKWVTREANYDDYIDKGRQALQIHKKQIEMAQRTRT